jgi:hypothetical protein
MGPFGLCAECTLVTHAEAMSGIARLGDYLAAWAAFGRWLEERDGGDAPDEAANGSARRAGTISSGP